MTRVLFTVCCALLTAWALVSVAQQLPRGSGPGSRAPGGGSGACPVLPARCQINTPRFNFGRHTMSPTAPPIDAIATISVTCTRHPQDRLSLEVHFNLWAETVQSPPRQMRDEAGGAYLAYDMYIDPARTKLWGSGVAADTFPLESDCLLNEHNRVCTIAFPLYGRVHGNQHQVRANPYIGALITRLEYRFVACMTL